MKNILKETTIFTIITLYFIYILKNNTHISKIILTTYNIWLTKLIPNLFFTFIIIDLINNSNIPYYLEKYLHLNYIYILSIISGSPSNAYMLKESNEDITKQLALTKYTSLIFTYTSLKIIFTKKIAIILIISNIISNFLLLIILKPPITNYPKRNKKIIEILPLSINKSFNTLITILATTIFFTTLPISKIKNNIIKIFIYSLLEITTFFINISSANLNLNLKILFTIIALNTCGLSIETQIKNITKSSKINHKKYLEIRLIHLIFFLSINYLLLFICN